MFQKLRKIRKKQSIKLKNGKNRIRRLTLSLLSISLVLSLILQIIPPKVIHAAGLILMAKQQPTLAMSFSPAGNDKDVVAAGDGKYILSNGAELTITVTITPQNFSDPDQIGGIYAKLQLPFLKSDGTMGNDLTDYGYGGVYAKVSNDGDGQWKDMDYIQSNPDSTGVTDPTKKFTGSQFRLDYNGSIHPGKAPQFQIKIGFQSNTMENAVVQVKGICGFAQWTHEDDNGDNVTQPVTYENADDNNATVTVVNSNLKWTSSFQPITGTTPDTASAIWQKYNYQKFEATIQNTSEMTAPYFDEFALNFRFQSFNGVTDGVLDKYMTPWVYNKTTGQAETNPDPTHTTANELYVGVPNQGGILIYDVTNLSEDDIKTGKNLGNPLPYTYNGQGIGAVRIEKDKGGTLHSPLYLQAHPGENACDKRKYLFVVPYADNFTPVSNNYYTLTDQMTPTVFFGAPTVSYSHSTIACNDYFEKPSLGCSITKKVQSDPAYVGQEASYTISDITNNSNIPVFNPYVIDTVPDSFEMNKIVYTLTDAEAGTNPDKLTFTDIFNSTSPYDFEIKKADGSTEWVPFNSVNEVLPAQLGESSWQIAGAKDTVDTYLKNHPGTTFTQRIRINFKYSFDRYESADEKLGINQKIPGTITITGYPRKVLKITNNADLYYDYYYFKEDSTEGAAHWANMKRGPVSSAVDKNIEKPDLWVAATGVFDNGNAEDREEGDPVNGAIDQTINGFVIRFGVKNLSALTPGYLDLKIPYNPGTSFSGFASSSLFIKKELLDRISINKIEITDFNGAVTTYNLTQLNAKKDAGGNISLKPSDWTNTGYVPGNAAWGASSGEPIKVRLGFDELKQNTPPFSANPENDPAYIQLMGKTNLSGTSTLNAELNTNYSDGLQQNWSVSDPGSIYIEEVKPTVEAKANVTNTDAARGVTEQHQSTVTVPDSWPASYSFNLGNDAQTAMISDSTFSIDMNNRVRQPGTDPHGFLAGSLAISGNYLDSFLSKREDGSDNPGIEKIEVYDYNNDTDTPNCVLSISQGEKQSDNSILIRSSLWTSQGVKYPKKFKLILDNFKPNRQGSDRPKITVNGTTDWYTFYQNDSLSNKANAWEKLQAKGTFTVNDHVHSVNSTAYMDVPIPKPQISADYANYYENAQSEETLPSSEVTSESLGAVDGKRSYLAVPYEKTVTQRFCIYQPSMSTADEFTDSIQIPVNSANASSEAKRGFHAAEVLVKRSLFDGSAFQNFQLVLKDITDSSKTLTITYDKSSDLFFMKDSSGASVNASGLQYSGGDLTIPNTVWEATGFSILGSVVLSGNNFITKQKDYSSDIEVTGFSDSYFGHDDISKTQADTYLGNIGPDVPKTNVYLCRWQDEGRLRVSQMYFDTQVETGYTTAGNTVSRYEATGISSEHARLNDPIPAYDNYFRDNTQLEVGYKSLASVGVDFRQYLNDYTTGVPVLIPSTANGHDDISHSAGYAPDNVANEEPVDTNGQHYVKSYAYNTKADLDLTINLPADQGFETYYLKIDPRSVEGSNGQKYIQSIDVIRKDGSKITVSGSSLVKNSSKWNDNSGTWYRINLLNTDGNLTVTDSNYKSVTEDNDYYRKPSESMGSNPVEKVMIHVKLNQNDSFNGTNAARPDFGSWVNDDGQDNQHMFEFVGRCDKVGSMKATAAARLTVGDREINATSGEKNPQRVQDGNNNTTGTRLQSDWSYANYYRQWYLNYYDSWTYNLREFTARDIYSTANMSVVENSSLDNDKGVENGFSSNSKLDYVYGKNEPYNLTLFRANYPNYESSVGTDWLNYDWNGYGRHSNSSYIDSGTMTDTMPPLIGTKASATGYQGFKPTLFQIDAGLLSLAGSVTFTLKDGTKITRTKDDFNGITPVNGYYLIHIYYSDDAAGSPSATDIQLTADNSFNYIKIVSLNITDLDGDGDFASDIHGRPSNTYLDGKNNTMLIRCYGDVNVVNGQETPANQPNDGKNELQSNVTNKNGTQLGTGTYTNYAIMKAHQVQLLASSTIASKQVTAWDYEKDDPDQPQLSNYTLNLKNTGIISDVSDPNVNADIDQIDFTQPLASQFRLSKIKIPEYVFSGSKWKVTSFTVTDSNGNHPDVVSKFVGPETDPLNPSDPTKYYFLDVSALYSGSSPLLTPSVYGYNGVTYEARRITQFSAHVEASNPNPDDISTYLRPKEDLDASADDFTFSGIWVDRTHQDNTDDVWNDNSTPTFGKNPYYFESWHNPPAYNDTQFTFPTCSVFKVHSPTFGASALSYSGNSYTQYLKNRVSALDMDVSRGAAVTVNGSSKISFAYDNTMNPATPEDINHLLPGDRINYMVTVSSPGNAGEDAALKNPVTRFIAPKGTRIVGWKFDNTYSGGANDEIISPTDLAASLYKTTSDSAPALTPLSGDDFARDAADKAKTNYKDLVIRTNGDKDLKVGGSYRFTVILELTDDFTSSDTASFSGQAFIPQITVSAAHRHNYDSYYTYQRTDTIYKTTLSDLSPLTSTSGWSRASVNANRDGINENGISVTGQLNFYTYKAPQVTYAFTNPEKEQIDKYEAVLSVKNICNDTQHTESEQSETVDFVKRETAGQSKQYFKLTKRPSILYTVAGVTRSAKIYYRTASTPAGNWLELDSTPLPDPTAENGFLQSITQLKWTYSDIPAFANESDSSTYTMDVVVLTGTAYYQDERSNPQTQVQSKNFSTMPAYLQQNQIHTHEAQSMNGETEIPADIVNMQTANQTYEDVYRQRPDLELNLQAFDKNSDAMAAYNSSANIKLGYRPDEEFWYKLTVSNHSQPTDLGTGPLLAPIIYDKLPVQYLDTEGDFTVLIRHADGSVTDLSENFKNTPGALTSQDTRDLDIGGSQSFNYISSNSSNVGNDQPTDTAKNPADNIKFTIYKFDFSKIGTDLGRGENIEIMYKVKAHSSGLPLAKWQNTGNPQQDGRDAYLPRFGEYGNPSYNTMNPTPAQTKDKMMDMDSLLHEFCVTGTPNDHTDRFEFLNGTTTNLPGAASNSRAIKNWDYYHNNTIGNDLSNFWGSNIDSSQHQQITVGMASDGDTAHLSLPEIYRNYIPNNGVGITGTSQSYYTDLTSGRTKTDNTDWQSLLPTENNCQNMVWAENSIHLQKAWVYGASEMVSSNGNKYYDNGSENPENERYYNCADTGPHGTLSSDDYMKKDDATPALEYTENYSSRLYAVNYGDWDVNGTEFTYIFPKGCKPNFDSDGNLAITGRMYDGSKVGAGNSNQEFTNASKWTISVNSSDISYKILQSPENEKGVLPSNSIVDFARNAGSATTYSSADAAGCWVIQVTVKTPLKKWWNRGSQASYVMAVDIPSHVYQDTMDGYWYDRLYVAPTDTPENAYYQIYDKSLQTDKTYTTGTMQYNWDDGGMDDFFKCYNWYTHIRPISGFMAPAGFYVDGYNQMDRLAESSADSNVLSESNSNLVNTDTSTGSISKRWYAEAGSRAAVREPFLRFWADMGTRGTDGTLNESSFYSQAESDVLKLNLNVENRYYADEYGYDGDPSNYNYYESRQQYSYNIADGGARGTLFDPVVTVVLPYGMIPVNKDGDVFSENYDATPKNGDNNDTDAVKWELKPNYWNTAENKNDYQKPYSLSDTDAQKLNLMKEKFNASVGFDSSTKQYIIRFTPKAHASEDDVKLLNNQLFTISMDVVPYDYGGNAPGVASKSKSWDDVKVYLGSSHNVFRYTADNKLNSPSKISGNPYQVGAGRLNSNLNDYQRKTQFSYDPRLDSVCYLNTDKETVFGTGKLGKIQVKNSSSVPFGPAGNYTETGIASGSLPNSMQKDGGYDINGDGDILFTNEAAKTSLGSGAVEDAGVSNTLQITSRQPVINCDTKLSSVADNPSAEVSDGTYGKAFCYGDKVWYGVEVKNQKPGNTVYIANTGTYSEDLQYSGDVMHSTFTLSEYLPDSLRYDGDYCIEYNDADGNTQRIFKDQLKAAGWQVQVKVIPADSAKPNGAQIIRANVVPAGDKTVTSANIYHKGGILPPGSLKNDKSFTLKLMTRVAETPAMDGNELWQEKQGTAYVNLHGTDGSSISVDTLQPADTPAPFRSQPIESVVYKNDLGPTVPADSGNNDYDQDGAKDGERYTYDSFAQFNIEEPNVTVRADTVRPRRVFSADPITGEVGSRDALYKMSESMDLVVDQAVLNQGALNQFVVQYNVPYRGTTYPTPGVATPSDALMSVAVKSISTGVWEVPVAAVNHDELASHLKVHVYTLNGNSSETYSNLTDSSDSGLNWMEITPEGGDSLTANKTYTINSGTVTDNPQTRIKQIRWVIQSDDPQHYPVPKGFRLDVDADDRIAGKQEVNDVDPLQANTKEGLHGSEFTNNVKINALHVTAESKIEEQTSSGKSLNYFTSAWGQYSDTEKNKIASDYRMGYDVTPERPYMDLFSQTKYLKADKTGTNFKWDSNLQLNLNTSRIIKQQVTLLDASDKMMQICNPPKTGEDILSKPCITVALPYRETITPDKFAYVDYNDVASNTTNVLNDGYTTNDAISVQNQKLYWTAYVTDADGNRTSLSDSKCPLTIAGAPGFYKLSLYGEGDRNMITWQFNQSLKPGQSIVVEYLASIADGANSNNPADMQTKLFALKDGAFMPAQIPVKQNPTDTVFTDSSVALLPDRDDVNKNNNTNEMLLELSSQAVTFQSNPGLDRRKKVTTDLNTTNVESKLPLPVQEGGIYTFTSTLQDLNNVPSPDFKNPVMFDILPYLGDTLITGSKSADGSYKSNPRDSKWNGWLIPDSFKLVQYNSVGASEITSDKYDIWVGPIQKQPDGSYKLLYDADGNPQIPDVNERSQDAFYQKMVNDNTYLTKSFINVKELIAAKNSIPNYQELVKGIRMWFVKFKDPQTQVQGSSRLEMQYSMQTPLNLPIFKGNLPDNAQQSNYGEYVGWNTTAGTALNYNSADGTNFNPGDSNEAGVFTDAPAGRGYIGDYVWRDMNCDAKQNEAEYSHIVNGRKLPSKFCDLDGDGKPDDPGINGVKVELLTASGYPCNVDGQAVVPATDLGSKGGYYVIDESTGSYRLVNGMRQWTAKGPAVTYTQSDYYGNQGYYIMANLAPGNYKARFTLPDNIKGYALTTRTVKDNCKVNIFNPGETLPKLSTSFSNIAGNGTAVTNLTFMTDAFQVKAVDLSSDEAFAAYDQDATGVDIGIGRPVRYGGTVWNDSDRAFSEPCWYNGKLDTNTDGKQELGIPNAIVTAYEKGSAAPAVGMDGKVLTAKTDADGNYRFDSLWPNREYYFDIDSLLVDGQQYKTTPVMPGIKPADTDNVNDAADVMSGTKRVSRTNIFLTSVPKDSAGKAVFDVKSPDQYLANMNIDFGLVTARAGAIGNYAWIDENRNGVQDSGEKPFSGLSVKLDSYYYKDGGWNPVPNESARTLQTDSNGNYTFTNLPVSYRIQKTDATGKATGQYDEYVRGYRVSVPSMPAGYTYTLCRQGSDRSVDSDLRSDSFLSTPEEYIIVASKATDSTNPADVKTVDGVNYSVSSSEFKLDYDIGLVRDDVGKVSGLVWSDENRDGLQDKVENGISGIAVCLEQWDSDSPANPADSSSSESSSQSSSSTADSETSHLADSSAGSEIPAVAEYQEPTMKSDGIYHVVATTTTDMNGRYTFTNVPLYSSTVPTDYSGSEPYQPKNHPLRYRVRIVKPGHSDLTILDYSNNSRDNQDSDFGIPSIGNSTDGISDSFILVNKKAADAYGVEYDYTKALEMYRDAGIIIYDTKVKIGDRVWQDANRNGLQDNGEPGIPGVELTLYRFNPDKKEKLYTLDKDNIINGTETVQGIWEPCADVNGKTTTVTDKDGYYYFEVPVADLDEKSPHYLEPYRYRVSVKKVKNETLTIISAGKDPNKDSNGYQMSDVIDILDTDNDSSALTSSPSSNSLPSSSKAADDSGNNSISNSFMSNLTHVFQFVSLALFGENNRITLDKLGPVGTQSSVLSSTQSNSTVSNASSGNADSKNSGHISSSSSNSSGSASDSTSEAVRKLKGKTKPSNTPVGDVLGMPVGETYIAGGEFQIVKISSHGNSPNSSQHETVDFRTVHADLSMDFGFQPMINTQPPSGWTGSNPSGSSGIFDSSSNSSKKPSASSQKNSSKHRSSSSPIPDAVPETPGSFRTEKTGEDSWYIWLYVIVGALGLTVFLLTYDLHKKSKISSLEKKEKRK